MKSIVFLKRLEVAHSCLLDVISTQSQEHFRTNTKQVDFHGSTSTEIKNQWIRKTTTLTAAKLIQCHACTVFNDIIISSLVN